MPTYLARIERRDEITGREVHLRLVRDYEAVELVEDDEFVTVEMAIDPFADPAPKG